MINGELFNSTSVQDQAYLTTVEDWLAGGQNVSFNTKQKVMVKAPGPDTVSVFERVSTSSAKPSTSTRWVTLLPGFPDGSYGYAKVDGLLGSIPNPKLYIEYVGQGDSEKPKKYAYSSVERADLVEAQWKAHGIKRTVVVTFDYSSIVLLELLQRQRSSTSFPTRVEHVLMINGGLFADGHSHPFSTTPLLKTPFGAMGASAAQYSNLVFDTMLKPLYGKEYRRSKLTKQELREMKKAIRLHKGARFLSQAAGFVDEHKQNAARWNLQRIYEDYLHHQGITVHVVGSSEDPFEYKQVDLTKKRLGQYYPGVQTDRIPGGHLSTSEQAETLATMIETLARKEMTATARAAWTDF